MSRAQVAPGALRELVMLHGWGMNSRIWDDVVARLDPAWRIHRPELPGHGSEPALPAPQAASLQAMAARLVAEAPRRAVWLGWSLGALAALQVARDFPDRVAALVLVAATPKFVAAPDWPHGVEAALLEAFHHDLQADHRATLRRFAALQSRGRDDVRRLRTCIEQVAEPDPRGLAQGLDVLLQADLRATLPAVGLPTLVVMGGRDTLVRPAACSAFQAHFRNLFCHIIDGAGHAPFVSAPAQFTGLLQAFLDQQAAAA